MVIRGRTRNALGVVRRAWVRIPLSPLRFKKGSICCSLCNRILPFRFSGNGPICITSYNQNRKAMTVIIPTTTVPSKLRVFTATRKVGRAASSSMLEASGDHLPSCRKISCPINAAMTAIGTWFSQRMPHSGKAIRLSSIRGRTRGTNVTKAAPNMISNISHLTSIFPTPSQS